LSCISAALAAEEHHAVKVAPWMVAGAVAAFDDHDAKVKALALNKLMDINATAALKNRIAELLADMGRLKLMTPCSQF